MEPARTVGQPSGSNRFWQVYNWFGLGRDLWSLFIFAIAALPSGLMIALTTWWEHLPNVAQWLLGIGIFCICLFTLAQLWLLIFGEDRSSWHLKKCKIGAAFGSAILVTSIGITWFVVGRDFSHQQINKIVPPPALAAPVDPSPTFSLSPVDPEDESPNSAISIRRSEDVTVRGATGIGDAPHIAVQDSKNVKLKDILSIKPKDEKPPDRPH